MKSVTMQDVADAAGVAKGTVSRALNGAGYVHPKKIQAIHEAVEQLGYKLPPKEKRLRPNVDKKSSMASRSVTILLSNPRGLRWVMEFAPIYAYVLHGIETALKEQGVRMQVGSVQSSSELQQMLSVRPPEGIIMLASAQLREWYPLLRNFPCVSALGIPCDDLIDCVTYDRRATGRLPAEHFLKLGYQRVAILGAYEAGTETTFGTRRDTFVQTMVAGGAKVQELCSASLIEHQDPANQPRDDVMAALISQFAKAPERAQGLFVMADNLLPSVYHHLRQAGLTLGSGLTIVSCNAEKPYLIGLSPQPIRVEVPAEEIGRRAAEQLIWRRAHRDRMPARIVYPPTLVIPQDSAY